MSTSYRGRGKGHAWTYGVRECMLLYPCHFGKKRASEAWSTRCLRTLNPLPDKSYTDH